MFPLFDLDQSLSWERKGFNQTYLVGKAPRSKFHAGMIVMVHCQVGSEVSLRYAMKE